MWERSCCAERMTPHHARMCWATVADHPEHGKRDSAGHFGRSRDLIVPVVPSPRGSSRGPRPGRRRARRHRRRHARGAERDPDARAPAAGPRGPPGLRLNGRPIDAPATPPGGGRGRRRCRPRILAQRPSGRRLGGLARAPRRPSPGTPSWDGPFPRSRGVASTSTVAGRAPRRSCSRRGSVPTPARGGASSRPWRGRRAPAPTAGPIAGGATPATRTPWPRPSQTCRPRSRPRGSGPRSSWSATHWATSTSGSSPGSTRTRSAAWSSLIRSARTAFGA